MIQWAYPAAALFDLSECASQEQRSAPVRSSTQDISRPRTSKRASEGSGRTRGRRWPTNADLVRFGSMGFNFDRRERSISVLQVVRSFVTS